MGILNPTSDLNILCCAPKETSSGCSRLPTQLFKISETRKLPHTHICGVIYVSYNETTDNVFLYYESLVNFKLRVQTSQI